MEGVAVAQDQDWCSRLDAALVDPEGPVNGVGAVVTDDRVIIRDHGGAAMLGA